MATWYKDEEGTFWRLSKYSGGLQAEFPNGKFGEVVTREDAIRDFGIEQLPFEIGLICDQFDKIKVDGMRFDDVKTLRAGVIEIVSALRMQEANKQIVNSPMEEPKAD